jgi:hypothetical protein
MSARGRWRGRNYAEAPAVSGPVLRIRRPTITAERAVAIYWESLRLIELAAEQKRARTGATNTDPGEAKANQSGRAKASSD